MKKYEKQKNSITSSDIKIYYEQLQEIMVTKKRIPTYIITENNSIGKIIKEYGFFKNILNADGSFDNIKENFMWDSLNGQQLFLFSYGISNINLIKFIFDVLQTEKCSISINKIIAQYLDSKSKFIKDAKIIPKNLKGELKLSENKIQIKSIEDFENQYNEFFKEYKRWK